MPPDARHARTATAVRVVVQGGFFAGGQCRRDAQVHYAGGVRRRTTWMTVSVTVDGVTSCAPKRTLTAPEKPAPVVVINVPPSTGPLRGETCWTTGSHAT